MLRFSVAAVATCFASCFAESQIVDLPPSLEDLLQENTGEAGEEELDNGRCHRAFNRLRYDAINYNEVLSEFSGNNI